MKRFVLVLRSGTGAERAGNGAAHGSVFVALSNEPHAQLEMHHD
jgi:hypothetical protein